MKVFLLEDDWGRIDTLREVLGGADLTVATNVAEGLDRWAPPYELILLDHDLGEAVFMDSEHPNTGYQFLKAVLPGVEGRVVMIHSWNHDGAGRMRDLALEGKARSVLQAPFGAGMVMLLEHVVMALKEEQETAAMEEKDEEEVIG